MQTFALKKKIRMPGDLLTSLLFLFWNKIFHPIFKFLVWHFSHCFDRNKKKTFIYISSLPVFTYHNSLTCVHNRFHFRKLDPLPYNSCQLTVAVKNWHCGPNNTTEKLRDYEFTVIITHTTKHNESPLIMPLQSTKHALPSWNSNLLNEF